MGPRYSRTSAPAAPPPPRVRSTPGVAASPRPGGAVISEITARRQPSDRDMRRKRPPLLSFLLRMSTARRVGRVLSLLALDFAGLSLAIFTALALKAAVLGHLNVAHAVTETLPRHSPPVRALGSLCRARRAAGTVADRREPFRGDVRRPAVRGCQRSAVLELLHLLWVARIRPAVRLVAACRLRADHRRDASRGRLPPARGSRRHRQAHRRCRKRPRRRSPRVDRGRRRSRQTACARWARSAICNRCSGPSTSMR